MKPKQPNRKERRKRLAEIKQTGKFNKVELAFLKRALKNGK